MGRAARKLRKNAEIQNVEPAYDVYIFHDPKKRPLGQDWERRRTTQDIQQAIHEAEELYKSHDYSRVEVRKKYFDVKKRRTVDKPVRIYGAQPERAARSIIRFLKFIFSLLAGYALVTIVAQSGI